MRQTSVGKCAACGQSVRHFAGRTVCDGCGALLIRRASFDALFAGDVELLDDTPTQRVCPCCDHTLRSCRITIEGVQLDHDTLYCSRDGIWLAGGMLEHILVATERESHREVPALRGKSHPGPGLWDAERQAQIDTRVLAMRAWMKQAWLGLGVVIALAVVFTAGWWCVASMVVLAVIARWLHMRPAVRERGMRRMPPPPLTWVTALVRFIPLRLRS